MTTGDKIKFHRKQLGLTQTELGEKLNVKKNAVSKWECGRVDDIPTSKVKLLAELFDIPISYLVDDAKKPTPVSESELSADHKFLIDAIHSMSDDNVRKLRIIVEQVIGERD